MRKKYIVPKTEIIFVDAQPLMAALSRTGGTDPNGYNYDSGLYINNTDGDNSDVDAAKSYRSWSAWDE